MQNNFLDYTQLPLYYYYCYINNVEYILYGDENGNIFDLFKKINQGNLIINFINNKKNISAIIDECINIVSKEKKENRIIDHLLDCEKKLIKINNNLFFYSMKECYIYKYNKLYKEFLLEKEKNKNLQKQKEEIINLIKNNYIIVDDEKTFIDLVVNNNLKKSSDILNDLKNNTFKTFILKELKNLLSNIEDIYINILFLIENNSDIEIKIIDEKSKKIIDKNLNKKDLIEYIKNNINFPSMQCYYSYFNFKNEVITFKNTTDIKLLSYYKIYDFIDLLYVSLISCINFKIKFNICKNCGKAFIPKNRSDEVYCDNISPQNKNKTCKEYGVKKIYRDKLYSDNIKKEHYNTSQYFRMKIKREKSQKTKEELSKLFEKYKTEYQKQTIKFTKKKITESDFVEWIRNQKKL